MASNSPQQRTMNRRSHGPALPGPMHSVQQQQPRESSRSPSLRERPRTVKTQSMPGQQIFAAAAPQQQSSPTIPTTGISARMLPIPPDQLNGQAHDEIQDRRPSSSPIPLYPIAQVSPHYPRPIPRQQPTFLTKFTGMESEQHMTEVLADIERVDQQQNQFAAYPSPYTQQNARSDTPSPPKDPNVERIRNMERASPIHPDPRRQREQARDSPKARQPNSPGVPPFSQNSDRPQSPSSIGIEQQHPAPVYSRDYGTRDSPNAPRRPTIGTSDPRGTMSFTPPLQSVARTPDRSLPVQEEAEDEFGVGSKNRWQGSDMTLVESNHRSSPTPSSDLNPEGNQRYDHNPGGRDSREGRDVNEIGSRNDVGGRYSEEDSGSYTPRSPTVSLPPPETARPTEKYYQSQTQRVSPKATIKIKTRNGSTDRLGLRSLTPSVFESPASTMISTTSHSSNYVDHRQVHDNQGQRQSVPSPQQQVYQGQQQYQQAPQQLPQVQHSYQPQQQQQQQQQYQQPQQRELQAQAPQHSQQPEQSQQFQQSHQHSIEEAQAQLNNHYKANGYYAQPHVYPDDFQNYSEDPASFSYLHAYLASPRPDAPIPPTPHSQTTAPSPSPFPSYGGKLIGPYSPIPPVGSPYPYPFTHVPRNRMAGPSLSQYSSNYADPNNPSVVREQLEKQWRVYLQNQINGNITDSTFSPAATPFQGANYNPFAFLHTARLMRQARDTMSIRSSPSHEPVALPPAPTLNKVDKSVPKRQGTGRKPPPRVDSTVPRDTTPEPTSSGEETAGEYSILNGGGEERHTPGAGLGIHTAKSGVWTSPKQADDETEESTQVNDDDEDDWVDEDEDGDDGDMLDFEFHPNYVTNADRRRRRWEVGWDALVQAFQNLDRQTDTTMIVLAAPAHSNKLHSIRSRAIRRSTQLSKSTNLKEVRTNFKRLATQRKNMRSVKPMSIAEKLLESQSTSGDGSDGSSESREEDLRRALETALGSLTLLNGMYEMRETKWQEEMKRMQEDREKMALVIRQVLGDVPPKPAPINLLD